MRSVPISRGLFALVDDKDFALVSRYKWHAIPRRGDGERYGWYARGHVGGRNTYMHRLLIPGFPEVDHIDGDGLNNQRSNLRGCTHKQNGANCNHKPGVSGFRGVHFHKLRAHYQRPFQAVIAPGGRKHSLGYYATPEEAARVYDAAAREHFGEFARLNFTERSYD